MSVSPLAGKPAEPSMLINVPRLVTSYYTGRPDPSVPAQRVVFGTSGHRGSSLDHAFNEAHILAITQAICLYRQHHGIDGPLFIGMDTHALSEPAFASALEVLAANGVEVMVDATHPYTPTPVISHAILTHNRDRTRGVADGIVITPSHNPPQYGGFKYDPPQGGPADTHVTAWIEQRANACLADGLRGVRRVSLERARKASTTHLHDYLEAYVGDLPAVVDLEAIRGSRVHVGVDPLGGASVAYRDAIGERYGLNLEVVNHTIDPTFRFMTVDWDGQIRMDPSSPYAMARLVGLKARFDVACASDTDADRHGIVSHSQGLLNPNQYLAVAIAYLFANRPQWPGTVAVGKTVVSSSLIDRVAAHLGRRLVEVPVGFKWFVDGILDGSLGFGGEESSGATFLRRDGTVWTTDKDGLVPNLLAAEITAKTGRDPGEHYRELTRRFGEPRYERLDAPVTPEQKPVLERLSPQQIQATELAGEKIQTILTAAPGNGAPIGGIKVIAEHGWFAARPSGTEEVYKIYAESFQGEDHLRRLLEEAQGLIGKAFAAAAQGQRSGGGRRMTARLEIRASTTAPPQILWEAEERAREKQQAADRAVAYVQSGMVVGLGAWSTAVLAVRRIGQLLRQGRLRDIVGVPCSSAIEAEARALGIPITLDPPGMVDLTIDGADEVDPELNLIKGGGGALLHEKIVAQASLREVIIVDESKLSPALGTHWAVPGDYRPAAGTGQGGKP